MAGLLIAVAAPIAPAASDPAPSSGASEKSASSSAAHQSAARHRHTARPATYQATSRKEHTKDLAGRPTTTSPARSADKKLPKQPAGLGSFSLGVETEQNVKRRSIRGGEYDPERDGEPKGYRPPFLGFSLKAPLSW